MPAVRRISRDAIVDAAVEVLREGGFSAVNARSVAKKLGCSTQPIYSSFQNMDELKAALRARAIALHTQRVQDSLRAHEGNDTRYSSYGMGFVKFAAEEKQLLSMIGSVDLSDGTAITLTYLDRFTVRMPWDADLGYKLENVRRVVDELEANETGVIDLMTDGKASFIPSK